MMQALTATLLFLTQFLLVCFVLVRAIAVPSILLVIEPTQLARRFLRRWRNDQSKAVLDINVTGKDLERTVNGWFATGLALTLCVLAFLLERHIGYVFLAGAFIVPRLTASADPVDERRFEQFTRTLAATSDVTLIAALFVALIFRPVLDVFGLLAFLFLTREVLLVLARRWLESEPEFSEYEEERGFTVQVGDEPQRQDRPDQP